MPGLAEIAPAQAAPITSDPTPTPVPLPAPKEASQATDTDYDRFEKMAKENVALVLHSIDERVQDPAERKKIAGMIFQGKPEDILTKVFEIGDELKIQRFQQEDPTFNEAFAFARGADKTVTFGAASAIVDSVADMHERGRLLEKAYPKSVMTGEIAGFAPMVALQLLSGGTAGAGALTTKQLLKSGGAGLFEIATKTRAGLGKFAAEFLSKRGGMEAMGKILANTAASKNFLLRAADLGVGAATFETVKEAVAIADDNAAKRPVGNVAERLVNKATESFAGGALFGLGFEALAGTAKATTAFTRSALGRGAMILGRTDGKYISKNLDIITEVLEKTPEAVIAAEAKVIEAGAKKFESAIVDRQEAIRMSMKEQTAAFEAKVDAAKIQMKDELLAAANQQKAALDAALQDTGVSLQKEIVNLTKAEAKNVATAARGLYDAVDAGYRAVGREYREGLEVAVGQAKAKGINPRVDSGPISEIIENHLIKHGAFDKRGPLVGSDFARTYPQLFVDLADKWRRFGGSVRQKGGSAGTTSIDDALTIKREVGELSNFGKQATLEEAIYKSIYHELKKQTETALPELGKINARYSDKRGKLDDFRNAMGKTEVRVAKFLEGTEKDRGSNILMGETFRAVGEVSPEIALQVGQALPLKERLQILNQFQKNPRTVVNEIRQAFVKGDQVLIERLENLAEQYPKTAPYLQKARAQSEMVKKLSDVEAINRAVNDTDFKARLAAQRPDLMPMQQELEELGRRRAAFRETFPARPRALERRLLSEEFGATGAEREQITALGGAAPETTAAINKTGVARDVGKQLRGEVTKGELPEGVGNRVIAGLEAFLPLGIGETLFQVRKKFTPMGFKFYAKMQAASPGTKKVVGEAILESPAILGNEVFPKEKLGQLARVVGAETALRIYAQNGGEEEVRQAIETVAADFERQTEGN